MSTPRPQPLIFVTNGEDEFLAVVRQLLEEEGFAVETMKLADDPFPAILQTQPDLLVVDFPHDEDSAWQLLAKLEAHPVTRDIALLATSTDEGNLAAVPGLVNTRRMHSLLVKPLDLDQLLALINHLLPDSVASSP